MDRFDELLLEIVKELQSVEELFDLFFGFLGRQTSYFNELKSEEAAKMELLNCFQKHYESVRRRTVILGVQFRDQSVRDLAGKISSHINGKSASHGFVASSLDDDVKGDCGEQFCCGRCGDDVVAPNRKVVNNLADRSTWCWRRSLSAEFVRASATGGFLLQVQEPDGRIPLPWEAQAEEALAQQCGIRIMTYPVGDDSTFNSSTLDDILTRAAGRDPLEEKLSTICDTSALAKDRAKAANGLTILLRGAEGDYMARVAGAEGIVQAIIELLQEVDPWVRGAGAGLLANMTGPGCPLQTRIQLAGTRSLLPTLAIELKSGSDYGRHASAMTFRNLARAPENKPLLQPFADALRASLRDTNLQVKQEAAKAMELADLRRLPAKGEAAGGGNNNNMIANIAAAAKQQAEQQEALQAVIQDNGK